MQIKIVEIGHIVPISIFRRFANLATEFLRLLKTKLTLIKTHENSSGFI